MREEKVIHKDDAASDGAENIANPKAPALSASMVERVARAMCAQMGIHADDWHEDNGVRTYAWELEADTARAAIEAMREPTDRMARLIYFSHPKVSGEVGPLIWKAMIDQALKP